MWCSAAQIVRTERRTKDIIVFPQLSQDRSPKRKLWLARIRRENLAADTLEFYRVFGDQFIGSLSKHDSDGSETVI